MNDQFALFILFIIAVSLAFRFIAGYSDRERIRQYFANINGELLSANCDPFGPGWIGDRDRIYRVRYRDDQGCVHAAHIKTSLLSGVYLTNDEIISRPPPAASTYRPKHPAEPVQQETVEEEKARLRKRLAELEERE